MGADSDTVAYLRARDRRRRRAWLIALVVAVAGVGTGVVVYQTHAAADRHECEVNEYLGGDEC
jgi:hypothetical protein